MTDLVGASLYFAFSGFWLATESKLSIFTLGRAVAWPLSLRLGVPGVLRFTPDWGASDTESWPSSSRT